MPHINDAAYDAALEWIRSNGDTQHLCSQEPTNYTEASSTYALASAAVTPGAVTDGSVSGRGFTVPAVTDDPVDVSGTGTHLALTDGASILAAATALTASQVVTAPNPYSTASWEVSILDVA